jgi:hypothetical protein
MRRDAGDRAEVADVRARGQMSHLEADADSTTEIRSRLVRSRHLRHPTPLTRSHPHEPTRGVRVRTVFAPSPLGGRGAGALVERGVHPDLDIALEGS